MLVTVKVIVKVFNQHFDVGTLPVVRMTLFIIKLEQIYIHHHYTLSAQVTSVVQFALHLLETGCKRGLVKLGSEGGEQVAIHVDTFPYHVFRKGRCCWRSDEGGEAYVGKLLAQHASGSHHLHSSVGIGAYGYDDVLRTHW